MAAMGKDKFVRKPLVVFGPAGVGKTTLIRKLVEAHPETAAKSVSYTTRKPRSHEKDGVDYHFVSREEFTKMKNDGELVEYTERDGEFFGTREATVYEVMKSAVVCVLDLDIHGCMSVQDADIAARYVLIEGPTADELTARLVKRGVDEKKARERVERDLKQLKEGEKKIHFEKKIENHDVNKATEELISYFVSTFHGRKPSA